MGVAECNRQVREVQGETEIGNIQQPSSDWDSTEAGVGAKSFLSKMGFVIRGNEMMVAFANQIRPLVGSVRDDETTPSINGDRVRGTDKCHTKHGDEAKRPTI